MKTIWMFVAGLLIGVVLALFAAQAVGMRWRQFTKDGVVVTRFDNWTGKVAFIGQILEETDTPCLAPGWKRVMDPYPGTDVTE